MGITWTDDQRRVIELRDKNILVSAAAGSGKTTVLVQRIIEKLMDKTNPTDIDRFLIVTFTNAAAAEMRERISDAIEAELERNPDNENLLRQSALVYNAQISTIDSFCLSVIKNEFHKIDLDPVFRIANEDELSLIKSDVMDELLIKAYESGDADFLKLVDIASPLKNDEPLKQLIFDLFRASMSQPWPKEWLRGAKENYLVKSEEDIQNSEWMKLYLSELKYIATEGLNKMNICLEIAKLPDMSYLYGQASEEVAIIQDICDSKTLDEFIIKADAFKFGTIKKGETNEAREKYIAYRNAAKKVIMEKLRKELDGASVSDTLFMLQKMAPVVEALIKVTEQFIDDYAAEKMKRSLLDFNDVEHLTLQIFVNEDTKAITETAKEYAKRYDEIMIDEYQDSNMLQETILNAISGADEGRNHMFMVGDVKQSIYRFRQARPDLFVRKYDRYSDTEGNDIKIELDSNFRSRKEVIDFSNGIFESLMKRDLGDVEYDLKASLKYGANYDLAEGFDPEVMLIDSEDELLEDADLSGKGSLEGAAIATRIRRLLAETKTKDKETGELRSLKFSDIVVLFRAMGPHSMEVATQLRDAGIPVHEVSKTGYFKTKEVQTVVNLLKIIDNPVQDIPLAAVMHSVIGGFSDEDMALIKGAYEGKQGFAKAVFSYKNLNIPVEITEKLDMFFDMLDDFREQSKELTIYELLGYVLNKTGYLSYVTVMPFGYQRRANLSMLLEKAREYEKTSYRGLFHFIRYVDLLIKYDIDSGEAEAVSENEDAVRFITIHKSKGLEYPVVFVAGMGRQFNKRDKEGFMVIHPELGIGMDYFDSELRLKAKNILCKTVKKQIARESMGEELRILYVALTRAKEKLIISGTVANIDDCMKKWAMNCESGEISYVNRLGAVTYFDLIIPAVILSSEKSIRRVGIEELMLDEEKLMLSRKNRIEELFSDSEVDSAICDEVQRDFSYTYPYMAEIGQKIKYSVSEIKHKRMDEIDSDEKKLNEAYNIAPKEENTEKYEESEEDRKLAQKYPGVSKGALRGTAMHRAMECFDIVSIVNSDNKGKLIEKEIIRCLDEGLFEEEQPRLLSIPKIIAFYDSNLAKRMAKAKEEGNLFVEKPFVMGRPIRKLDKECDSDEIGLIQGIIDAFFIEDNKIVVLDYKTDKVENEDKLVERYKVQLDLYADALKSALEMEVKESILYSFYFGKEIVL